MIITRSPLRISIGGGACDIPSFYQKNGGFWISAAIDKYVYVSVMRKFSEEIFLKYSEIEKVKTVDEIKHPIIREAVRLLNFKTPQLEITTMADIPASTGLGGSGSFSTALLKSLYVHRKKMITQKELAELACHLAMDILKEPSGKQDEYIASYGGITCFYADPNGEVFAEPLNISVNTLFDLEENLLLFFTGYSHNSSEILSDQNDKLKSNDKEMIGNIDYIQGLAYKIKDALEVNDTIKFGQLMHEHWQVKRIRSSNMTNPKIDEWYNMAVMNGAVGGKLVGSGNGGFLMFYANDRDKLRYTMNKQGLEELKFKFDFEGTKVILS